MSYQTQLCVHADAVDSISAVRIGAVITVEVIQGHEFQATRKRSFLLRLGRGLLCQQNQNLRRGDYVVRKLNDSNATHLLTSNLRA